MVIGSNPIRVNFLSLLATVNKLHMHYYYYHHHHQQQQQQQQQHYGANILLKHKFFIH
jgi:hypothetical protein